MEELTEKDLNDAINEEVRIILFLYTPLCGTCKVAEQMINPLEKLLSEERFVKSNANLIPAFLTREEVTSVPCLKVIERGRTLKTIYAFHSVPSLVARLYPLLKHASE